MKKYIGIFVIVLLFAINATAQVIINEDSEVASLVQRHMDENRMSYALSGYRIQLMATTDRRKVEREESNFVQRYPGVSVNWEHSKPYYKLKAGAFATKLDATRMLKELKKDYPSALLTKSDINISELLN